MSSESTDGRSVIVEQIVTLLTADQPSALGHKLGVFARQFLRRVPESALQQRSADNWAAQLRQTFDAANERMPGQIRVNVFNPTDDTHGWTSGHTIVEVFDDDMPFLVDSTTLAISEENLSIHGIIHPVFRVVRDAGGFLMNLSPLSEELDGSVPESMMHFQIDRMADPAARAALATKIERHLVDVQHAVRDWRAMLAMFDAARAELSDAKTPYEDDEIEETVAFLEWLEDNHFTLLGYREYRIDADSLLQIVPDSGLGILSSENGEHGTRTPTGLISPDARKIAQSGPLIITKTNARSTVHRSGYMDYVGVMLFNSKGRVVGERRFLGLYTSSAYNRRPWNIPFVRRKVEAVMAASGYSYESHGGKGLLHIMETLPRDELFQASQQQLNDLVVGIFDLQERQNTRLFIRPDRFGRFYSCLVYIPRERFNTETREKVQGILTRALRGQQIDFAVQVAESMLARLHVIVRVDPTQHIEYDVAEIERRLVDAVRSWHDKLQAILIDKHGEDQGMTWARTFGKAFPAAYMEDVTPWVAAFDVENAAKLHDLDDLRMSLYRPRRRHVGLFRFKVFRCGSTIPLSDVLPMLENMGLRIVSERPYQLVLEDGSARWIQDFDMQLAWGGDLDLDRVREDFQTAFDRVVAGELENDGFNRLVLAARLNWRQVTALRCYCKYLLQTGLPFSQSYMERTLEHHPGISRLLVELFEALFDPARENQGAGEAEAAGRALKETLSSSSDLGTGALSEEIDDLAMARTQDRSAQSKACMSALRAALEEVSGLDEDRILRSFIGAIQATLRTNFFQSAQDGRPHPYLSIKLDSAKVPELPKPKPWREIFVYSPRVEGVHLRGGRVARGGLRWSDRREDFRTEVLGLMKAQMVKNTMIVPVGAKGGFVVKCLPEDGDRDTLMAEVVSCYRFFIHGLLDITDNLGPDGIIKPQSVVCRDDDDPYLVVAADKGTATFSDIANSVSEDHGFWLDDAFASGGSVGYDHKKMGITARGAWESVRRHFREMGVDSQNEDFTAVGIGDMAGDVFGNGMLLSRHIRLKAAFNHLHIFLDPEPDPATSFAERQRLFNLPRSSWTDYDTALISKGGGLFSRKDKQIPISPEVAEWLGIKANSLTPNELIRELLKAPVDLLWNGGIGTYVKAESETHTDVGDRANDALRVNGRELRCKVVGEGGNLGLTQRGRIEYALNGGRINTDFVDNSAGVDCSDHEVNIKILLNQATVAGRLDLEQRNALLAEMTDEVAELVLRNNYLQNLALSMMQSLTVSRLGSKAHFIDVLEASGVLDRDLEFLPGHEELAERRTQGIGLARPELSILLSYSKITLYQELLASDVPEDPYLSLELERYFPVPLRRQFGDLMAGHRLRREIIATAVTNSMVNRMGATFALRMHEDTGATSAEIAKAYSAAREIFMARNWWNAIEETDGRVHSAQQISVQTLIWGLLRHVTRWILTHHRAHLDIAALVDRYQAGAQELVALVPKVATANIARRIGSTQRQLEKAGFDSEFSAEVAGVGALNPTLDVIDVGQAGQRPVAEVAAVYYQLDRSLNLSWLMEEVETLPVEGQWHAHARGGLRDELFRQHRALTAKILASGHSGRAPDLVKSWTRANSNHLAYFEHMVADMKSSGTMDYATVSVAVRSLGQLVESVD